VLTRLKVTGFKNLVDVDVHFGPFTCIAGPNGVGKSNLFDAIRFLSALADRTFMDAAKSVRDESGRTGDIHALFHHVGDKAADRMRFEAEMIVPSTGTDDLGQRATTKTTYLRYAVELEYRPDGPDPARGNLELVEEELERIRTGGKQSVRFPHSPDWLHSVIRNTNREAPFISTERGSRGKRFICEHQDPGRGRYRRRPAELLPRTVLSAVSTSESPTALLARREMQSWRLLHLEPTALRRPDEFASQARLGADGSHLPATLYRLSREGERGASGIGDAYGRVAARLHDLIHDIRSIRVDRDEKRELLSLVATDRYRTPVAARALSDGTLRFLALTVLELDPEAVGVICFEEPENGIHPARIPAMLRLLQDIAVDPTLPVGPDNPLRQIVVNTHSPAVVANLEDACLLGAVPTSTVEGGRRSQVLSFRALPETWRARLSPPAPDLALNHISWYLHNGGMPARDPAPETNGHHEPGRPRLVRDREDVRAAFVGLGTDE